jgi:hypothetical protein
MEWSVRRRSWEMAPEAQVTGELLRAWCAHKYPGTHPDTYTGEADLGSWDGSTCTFGTLPTGRESDVVHLVVTCWCVSCIIVLRAFCC